MRLGCLTARSIVSPTRWVSYCRTKPINAIYYRARDRLTRSDLKLAAQTSGLFLDGPAQRQREVNRITDTNRRACRVQGKLLTMNRIARNPLLSRAQHLHQSHHPLRHPDHYKSARLTMLFLDMSG